MSINHELDENSLVFEVGGYQGKWSSKIIDLFNPTIYIFEPVPLFYSILKTRFEEYSEVKIYNIGLSDRDEITDFSVKADGSGRFGLKNESQRVELRDIHGFITEQDIKVIDLIQINIEGAEYQLLRRMTDTELTKRCRVIQVQFHKNVPNAESMRDGIRRRLSETHCLLYEYPFVWEAWRLRE